MYKEFPGDYRLSSEVIYQSYRFLLAKLCQNLWGAFSCSHLLPVTLNKAVQCAIYSAGEICHSDVIYFAHACAIFI